MSSPGHDEAGVGAHVLVRRVLVMCARDILSTLIFPFTTLPNISTVMAGPFITTTLARRSLAERHTLATFLFVLVNDIYVINKGRCVLVTAILFLVSLVSSLHSGLMECSGLLTEEPAANTISVSVG